MSMSLGVEVKHQHVLAIRTGTFSGFRGVGMKAQKEGKETKVILIAKRMDTQRAQQHPATK